MESCSNLKIYIASDHAGFHLKSVIIENLNSLNLQIENLGCDSSEIPVDYPDFAQKLAEKIDSSNKLGILICGSGIGISIAANRHKNIRAALCFNEEIAELSRNHNNSNVLCLGSKFLNEEQALLIVKKFISSKFDGGRHENRIKKIS